MIVNTSAVIESVKSFAIINPKRGLAHKKIKALTPKWVASIAEACV